MAGLKTGSYERWEKATRRWWFFLLLILVQLAPPYASKGYSWAETGVVTAHILRNSLMMGWTKAYPFFQIAAVLFIIGVILLRNRFSRVFSIYAGLSYLLFTVGQNISITEEYGTAVLSVNIIMFALVAAFWFWEAFQGRNDFSAWPRSPWRYWAAIPAFLAFWFPLDWATLRPDFNPIHGHFRLRPHLLHDDPGLPGSPDHPLPPDQPGHPAGHLLDRDNYRLLQYTGELHYGTRFVVERRAPPAAGHPLHLRAGYFAAKTGQCRSKGFDLTGTLIRSGLAEGASRLL